MNRNSTTSNQSFESRDEGTNSGLNGNVNSPTGTGTSTGETKLKAIRTTNDHASLAEAITQEVKQTSEAIPQILSNVFIPKWNNKPEEAPAILTLGGTPILTYQNTTTIIASPGVGKSAMCEAILAGVLNPDADTLGFSVNAACKGALYIDNERTNTDVWNSFYRMCKRAGLQGGADTSKVQIAGLRSVARAKDRRKVIEQLLEVGAYDLLLIDGAGDLVEDSNDNLEAIECRIWLREMTVKYQASILVTIHPSPNGTKPRGHVGSEACRESECVLIGKKIDDEVRVITSDFEHGKNRNNAPITTAYKWSDDIGMFMITDADSLPNLTVSKVDRSRTKLELLALKVIPAPKALSYSELVEEIMSCEGREIATAKRRIKALKAEGFIKEHTDGKFRISI